MPSEEVPKGSKKQTYCDSYLDIGFTEFPDRRPQCVICNKVLPNSSRFPAKLRWHFETHPETLAETVIKPLLVKVVKCTVDEKIANLIFSVPLSNITVRNRVQDLSNNVNKTIIAHYEFLGSFHEDILFCKPLPSSTSSSEIVSLLDAFFIENLIPWDNCIDVCTDGTKIMVGHVAGVVTRIKKVSKKCTSSHCVLHRHFLATKKMPALLQQILDNAVKIINFVKARPLQCRLLKILCEVSSLLNDQNSLLAVFMNAQAWLCKLCYLADSFLKMNEFSTSIQGKQNTIFNANDKIAALKKKIAFYMESVETKLLLLHFGTTYLCEMAFLSCTATKTKYRARLDAKDDMCLHLTSVTPDIDKLCRKKRAHCSH
ncbi:hypothetical protein GDO78_001455 [Eleutherodactylus coqui]|uniref:Zinc finger BED domain-containing protein 5 n=1 Tax=Eleutherodactylus coqui TaxID=57060 RepID=A0A8J6KHV8_ELECQ|nr:hypothetical protein GDO78_001455 [Eleutherodactylus coqui]